MTTIEQIQAEIEKIWATLSTRAIEPAPATAKDDLETWYSDLAKAWAFFRVEKDPKIKRQLDDLIKTLTALIDAIKKPASGVVKPPVVKPR